MEQKLDALAGRLPTAWLPLAVPLVSFQPSWPGSRPWEKFWTEVSWEQDISLRQPGHWTGLPPS